MTGGSPDYGDKEDDTDEGTRYSLAQNSIVTTETKSYFDPPIENYRRIYQKKTGSMISYNGGGLSPDSSVKNFQLRPNGKTNRKKMFRNSTVLADREYNRTTLSESEGKSPLLSNSGNDGGKHHNSALISDFDLRRTSEDNEDSRESLKRKLNHESFLKLPTVTAVQQHPSQFEIQGKRSLTNLRNESIDR